MSTKGKLGSIFWDLPPLMYYTPNYDIGVTIYTANPTDETREYMLMGYLYRGSIALIEAPLQVQGYAWFPVDSGVFVRFHGDMAFDETNAELVVSLIEKETQEATDSVSTRLLMPAMGILPPAWPAPTPEAPTTPSIDWSSIITMFIVIMMMKMMAGVFKEKEV